jgi:4-hydroxybenzoate polyprenyltransferase
LYRYFKKATDFFLFSSLFIALCAVSMVFQTYYLFHLPAYPDFIWFVFFGSLCSYNFHWYLTPGLYGGSYRTQWAIRNKKLHFLLFIIAFIGCAWFCIQLLSHWRWLLATAFITFLYSAPKVPFKPFLHLRKIAVGKTIFLSLVCAHITATLPLLLQNIHWQNQHFLFAINRFFLIYPICILFDYRDREEDRKEGIKSMITLFSEKGINILFFSSLTIFVITTIVLYFSGMNLIYCITLFLPGLIVGLLYNYSKKNTSDYYYYFFLDGLMMFSAVLLYIFSFSYI